MALMDLFVRIRAPFSGLRRDLARAERGVKRSAGKMVSALGKAGEAATKVQGALGMLLIPAAVIGSVVSLKDRIQAARDESEAFVKGLSDGLRDIQREVAVATGRMSEFDAGMQARLDTERELSEELIRQADSRSLIGGLFSDTIAKATGALTLEEKIAAAQEQQNKMAAARALLIKQNTKERREAEAAAKKEVLEEQTRLKLAELVGRAKKKKAEEEAELVAQAHYEAMRRADEKLARENEKRRIESNAKVAREFREGLDEAFRSSFALFETEGASSIGNLVDQLDARFDALERAQTLASARGAR